MVLFVVSVLMLVLAAVGVVDRSFKRLVLSPSFVAWGVFVVWFAFLGWAAFELGISFWYVVVPALVAVAWIDDDKV